MICNETMTEDVKNATGVINIQLDIQKKKREENHVIRIGKFL